MPIPTILECAAQICTNKKGKRKTAFHDSNAKQWHVHNESTLSIEKDVRLNCILSNFLYIKTVKPLNNSVRLDIC